jgi:hypothetical protein
LTQQTHNAIKASRDFKPLADILAEHGKNVWKSRDTREAQAAIDPIADTINEACETLAASKSTEFKNMLVRCNPTDIQRGCLGESGSLQTLQEHQFCIFCKHDSIDEPATNLHVRRQNNLKKLLVMSNLLPTIKLQAWGPPL